MNFDPITRSDLLCPLPCPMYQEVWAVAWGPSPWRAPLLAFLLSGVAVSWCSLSENHPFLCVSWLRQAPNAEG